VGDKPVRVQSLLRHDLSASQVPIPSYAFGSGEPRWPQQRAVLFDGLQSDAKRIEQSLGSDQSWERLDQRPASRLAKYRPAPDLTREQEVAEARTWAVEMLFKLMDVLDERLRGDAIKLRRK